MTDKTDKAAAVAAGKVDDKQDAAYKAYEKDQATYEKKNPGEINEPAYAKYEEAYDKAEGGRHHGRPGRPDRPSADRGEQQKKYDAAFAESTKAREAAVEARKKAIEKDKTPEQKTAEEAERKADDADAKAAALHPDLIPPKDVMPGNIDQTATRPIKLNVPEHPAYAPGIPTDDEAQTVNMFHTGEKGTERFYTRVHPDMVGDYLRAGWSRA